MTSRHCFCCSIGLVATVDPSQLSGIGEDSQKHPKLHRHHQCMVDHRQSPGSRDRISKRKLRRDLAVVGYNGHLCCLNREKIERNDWFGAYLSVRDLGQG